jgi:hypothetical protein
MDTRSLATVSLAMLALLLPLGASAADKAPDPAPQVTVTLPPAQPPLPEGATPLVQEGRTSRSVDRWPGYRLSPGPGGEVEAVVLSPERYRELVLMPRLVEAQGRVDTLMCRGEQRAQSDRHNEAAREWAAQLAAAKRVEPLPEWQRVVAWVGLGVAIGALAGGTAVWVAK